MANEALFKIACPSCEAVFAVTDSELVGQIIACPKCGGMILVEPQSEKDNDAAANNDVAPETEPSEHFNAQKSETSGSEAEPNKATVSIEIEPDKSSVLPEETGEGASESDAEDLLKTDGVSDFNEKRRRWLTPCCGVGAALLVVGAASFFFPSENDEISPTAAPNVAVNGDGTKETEDKKEKKEEAEGSVEAQVVKSEDEPDDFSDVSKPETTTIFDLEGTTAGEVANGESEAILTELDEEKVVSNETNVENTDSGELPEENVAEENAAEENVAEENVASPEIDVDLATPDSVAGEFNEEEFEKANTLSKNDVDSSGEKEEDDLGAVASTTTLTLPAQLPTMARETKAIDVDARLALRIRSIEFPTSPVAAVRLASEFSGVPIAFNLEAFDLLRPSTSAALDLTAQDVSVGEALEKIAALVNWTVVKEKGRVELTPKDFDPTVLVEERFDVGDLIHTPSDATIETEENAALNSFLIPEYLTVGALERLVETLVAPNSWSKNGGQGTLKWEGTSLIAFQSEQNRKKITVLLELLRALRRLDAKSDLPMDEVIPEALAWDELTKTASFNILSPTPLQNALEILENSSKFSFQILWDDAAMSEAGVGRDATISVCLDSGTYDAILSEMLEPLGLTYLVVSKNLLIITSDERAERYKTIETMFFAEPNAPRRTPEELENVATELKLAVSPNSWETPKNRENGTESTEDGDFYDSNVVWSDGASGSFVVRQSQPNQRAIRRWLTARNAAGKSSQSLKNADISNADDSKSED